MPNDGGDDTLGADDVAQMLSNPIYMGLGPYPRIVEPERWKTVQVKLIGELGPEAYVEQLAGNLLEHLGHPSTTRREDRRIGAMIPTDGERSASGWPKNLKVPEQGVVSGAFTSAPLRARDRIAVRADTGEPVVTPDRSRALLDAIREAFGGTFHQAFIMEANSGGNAPEAYALALEVLCTQGSWPFPECNCGPDLVHGPIHAKDCPLNLVHALLCPAELCPSVPPHDEEEGG